MANIRPYTISVPRSEVEFLNQKLLHSRFTELFDRSWERGVPGDDIKRIAKYWRDEFSWSSFEQRLNQLPNFEATITLDGFDPFPLHFIHHRSSSPDAIPLLFIHGWPGSFYEVSKILPHLIESDKNGGPSFHVIAPSLPNFGFSGRIDRPGFGIRQHAETLHQLMQSLGYHQYATQAGDWGSTIALTIASFHPESLRALHLNFIPASPPPITSPIAFIRFLVTHFLNLYSEREAAGLRAAEHHMHNGQGFFQIQKTRPNTIGVALADSPVGLLAWIYDKLVSWSDSYPWTEEEICQWVSLYWFSRAGPAASSMIYNEAFQGEWQAKAGMAAPGVKMGFSYFPKEIFTTPYAWNRRLGDVVFEQEHDAGGHFAAWEQPEALVGDLQIMFGKGGGGASESIDTSQPCKVNM